MLMLTFSLLLWGLVVQTCDGGREVNGEIMHSGDVYVSVSECHRFFLQHTAFPCALFERRLSPSISPFSIGLTGMMVYNYMIQMAASSI